MLKEHHCKRRGFVLLEALIGLSLTMVITMLLSVTVMQIINQEQARVERLDCFLVKLMELNRLEQWQPITGELVTLEQPQIKASNEGTFPIVEQVKSNYQFMTAEPICIPTITIQTSDYQEEFHYEIKVRETIRLYAD